MDLCDRHRADEVEVKQVNRKIFAIVTKVSYAGKATPWNLALEQPAFK